MLQNVTKKTRNDVNSFDWTKNIFSEDETENFLRFNFSSLSRRAKLVQGKWGEK